MLSITFVRVRAREEVQIPKIRARTSQQEIAHQILSFIGAGMDIHSILSEFSDDYELIIKKKEVIQNDSEKHELLTGFFSTILSYCVKASPVRMLISGIGDALATYYEAHAVSVAKKMTMAGGIC
ncbi:MAG: hypothetical protein EZS28_024584, partial [Streblomastix strix]